MSVGNPSWLRLFRASIDGQIQDKDHAVSQLAEDPRGAHLQGEDPD